MKKNLTDEQYRSLARGKYAREGAIEIDATAKVSRGDDPGAYVQAWVWVADEDQPDISLKDEGDFYKLRTLTPGGRKWVLKELESNVKEGEFITIGTSRVGKIIALAEADGLLVEQS